MSRLVRCPRCSKLLVENSTVPLYQCGGCGTVLRAKNYRASGDNAITEAPPQVGSNRENQSENVTSARNYKASGDDAITEPPQIGSNQESHTDETGISDTGSTSANEMILPSPKVHNEEEEERQMAPVDNPACSCIDDDQQNNKGELFETDSEIVQGGSILDSSKPNKESPVPVEGEDHVTTDQPKMESIDEQLDKLLIKAANDQDSARLKLKMTNEVESVASLEDLADTLQNHGLEDVSESPAAMLSSHAAFEGSISCDDGQTIQSPSRKQRPPEGKEQENYNAPLDHQLGARMSASSSSYESHIIDAIRNEISLLHYENGKQERVKSFGSTESQFAHNWTLEKKGGSSRGAHSHLELLRKINELRVQVTELCERSSPPEPGGGIHQIHQNFDPQCNNPSLNHHPGKPSYKQCTCLQCDREKQKLANLHKKEPYRTNANDMHSHSSKEHDSGEKPYLHNRLKHRCRPVSGAAPFVICYNCVKLLQLPADFLITRKKLHKLQCASCNEVLMFSFPDRASSNPETPSRSPAEVDKFRYGLNYHANDSPQGYPPLASFDDHGTPFAESEPPLPVSRQTSEKPHLKGKGPLRLHRLMGYGSASELLYQHEDSDDGSENSQILAHHSPSSSNEIHDSNKSGGSARSTPHNEQIRNTSSPDSICGNT